MKAPSKKQKQIIDFILQNDNKITKQQAVELIGACYYCNASKHVGDVLSRMVQSKLLNRIKNGLFEINQDKKQTVQGISNPNQLELL